MSNDRYHADIKRLLDKHGAMGVNQLAKELDVPLSTMQKYLDKQQTYFKKNHARKWVLPEVAANNDMSEASANYSNIINAQLMSMNVLIDTLMSQFRATITLIETNKPSNTPVAGKMPDIDPRFIELDQKAKDAQRLIKTHAKNVPEEYKDLVLNLDIVGLTIEKGKEYLFSAQNEDLAMLLSGQIDTLSEETLKMLESYQKEA